MTVHARRSAGLAALGTLAVLLATVDTRSYGLIPDGKEMLSAAAALARFGEIGISRDFVNAPRRPGGDAVSRYGMGLSLVEAVPAALARASGARHTAPLFVLLPVLCLAGCAWAAARALGRLGAGGFPAAAFGAALVLATPLWGYAGSDYGEPLQALCVSLSVLAVVELRLSPAPRRWQIVLGLAAGWAILTKTLLALVVAPFLLVAAIPRRARSQEDLSEGKGAGESSGRTGGRAARRRAARTAAPPAASFEVPWLLLLSFAGILLLWSLLESVRFGKLGGGYAGETFTYPFLTGLLRLTLLPNKGLLWYAPLVVLAVPGFFALLRRDAPLASVLAAAPLALLFVSSAWWAWDGQAGWGPRLLLPALPCLVLLAGVAFLSAGRGLQAVGALAMAAGLGVNALGAFVPFPAVYALSSRVAPQPISPVRAAGTPYEIGREKDGTLVATAPHHLSLTPAWSPIRVHALVLASRLRGGWDGALPSLDPPFRPDLPPEPAPALRLALSPVRPGWGRELFAAEGRRDVPAEGRADPWRDALRDQLVRAIDLRDWGRASALGGELERGEEEISSNDPRTVALVAEALRLGAGWGSREPGAGHESASSGARAPLDGAAAALSYLSRKLPAPSSSSSSFSCHPWILFVRAMAEPPGDFGCLPESQREAFGRAVEVARRRGWTLTEWSRAATTGRP